MKKGDIILVPFPFTDWSGNKTRPALVLINDVLDITVAFITSRTVKHVSNDMEINPGPTNGLKIPSLIKLSKLATIHRKFALGRLGELSLAELAEVDKNLIAVFDIKT